MYVGLSGKAHCLVHQQRCLVGPRVDERQSYRDAFSVRQYGRFLDAVKSLDRIKQVCVSCSCQVFVVAGRSRRQLQQHRDLSTTTQCAANAVRLTNSRSHPKTYLSTRELQKTREVQPSQRDRATTPTRMIVKLQILYARRRITSIVSDALALIFFL